METPKSWFVGRKRFILLNYYLTQCVIIVGIKVISDPLGWMQRISFVGDHLPSVMSEAADSCTDDLVQRARDVISYCMTRAMDPIPLGGPGSLAAVSESQNQEVEYLSAVARLLELGNQQGIDMNELGLRLLAPDPREEFIRCHLKGVEIPQILNKDRRLLFNPNWTAFSPQVC